jgi:hypothetical protein
MRYKKVNNRMAEWCSIMMNRKTINILTMELIISEISNASNYLYRFLEWMVHRDEKCRKRR